MMPTDIRMAAAQYYDTRPAPYDDVTFYRQRLPGAQARVLELGCGTGRVLIPLADACGAICGVDNSAAMLTLCREKMAAADLSVARAWVVEGDISDLQLGQGFDLIIAPFRVMQNLATNAELDGLFRTIRTHLAPGGTAVLNAFRPLLPREATIEKWLGEREVFNYEISTADGRLTRHHTTRQVELDPLVGWFDLIYRRYVGETLAEEAVLAIPMRAFYPEEFIALIEGHGFRVTERWGGYAGEAYGEGPELVVAFTEGAS